eukprot:361288-Chlamydomonas_euryale.AAC.1
MAVAAAAASAMTSRAALLKLKLALQATTVALWPLHNCHRHSSQQQRSQASLYSACLVAPAGTPLLWRHCWQHGCWQGRAQDGRVGSQAQGAGPPQKGGNGTTETDERKYAPAHTAATELHDADDVDV